MGAFSAGVLSAFEEVIRQETGKAIAEQFDLITGTSIGGISAVGLGMGGTIDQILKLYRDRGSRIFPRGSGVEGWLPEFFRNLFGPKYTSDELRQAIEEVVGTATLGEARTRLVIPAYDATLGRVYMFKTPHVPPGDRRDADERAVDVALATSAAPTYFPAHTISGRGVFIDGGVWANCPAMVGIVEAIEFCRQRLEDLRVLSISTTNYPYRLGDHQQRGGLIGWGPKILETFMFGQVQNAIAQATCLLRDRFHRVDFDANEGVYTIDDARIVEELITIGHSVGQAEAHTKVFRELFVRGSDEASTWSGVSNGGRARA
jgi:uncharacterized protein